MSLIYIPTSSIRIVNQTQLHPISSTPSPGFSLGEILEAGVVDKLDGRRMLIALKGVNISADSETTLNVGDTIRVKVESLHPQVVLRIVGQAHLEEFRVADYLKVFRSNPDALLTMITEAVDRFNAGNFVKIFRYIPEEDFKRIVRILKSLFLSSETRDTHFVKNYLQNLGLLNESLLRKVLEGEPGISDVDLDPQNLKSLLVKVSEDIHYLLSGKETFDYEERVLLNGLSKNVDLSIKTIENHQIINVILQESENKYLFQIPILCQDGVRKSDIFVEYDRNHRGKRDKSQYRIMFFLNMDILGDMIIEARLRGDTINCCIKCADHEVCDFISSFLEDLGKNLSAAGCTMGAVKCVTGGDLVKEKTEYYQERILYGREVINLFA